MKSHVRLIIRIISVVALLFLGYQRLHRPSISADSPPQDNAALIFSGSASVVFTIAPDGQNQWNATYAADGHTAHFKLALTPAVLDKSGIAFAKGRFVAVEGSDASSLLAALKVALQAKRLPDKTKRAAELPFTYAGLGDDQSRNDDGSFQSMPRGQWIVTKVFLNSDSEAGEVYLNLNPTTNQAEFSIKDPDYGDVVLSQLASVL